LKFETGREDSTRLQETHAHMFISYLACYNLNCILHSLYLFKYLITIHNLIVNQRMQEVFTN
jgi:hypothetical protein